MKQIIFFITLVILCLSLLADDLAVKPEFAYIEDARISEKLNFEGYIRINDHNNLNLAELHLLAGIPVSAKLELGAEWGFLSYYFERDGFKDQTGQSDLLIFGKYNFYEEELLFTAGSFLTLPVGDEDIGQGNTNAGLWGSIRLPYSAEMELLTSLGIDYYEKYNNAGNSNYDSRLNIKAGVLYQLDEYFTLIPEMQVITSIDYSLLSLAIDYKLNKVGNMRAAIGLGLDDGAPDLLIQLGLLYYNK